MEVTKELAEYILHLQNFKDSELGLEEEDQNIIRQIESKFPEIKEHRNQEAFNDWLWQVKVEENPLVMNIRAQIARTHQFGEKIRGTSSGEREYQDDLERLIHQLDTAKENAFKKLQGNPDIRKEFDIYRMKKRLAGV